MNRILRKWNDRVDAAKSLVCVGLDPELEKIPERFREAEFPFFEFNRWIIDETAEFTSAYKPNIAFFEARGVTGLIELQKTMQFLQEKHPSIVTVCDAKRGDNSNTNRGYVKAIFDELGADAVTLHSYLGAEALAPFLERTDKACVILCRTSNVGAREFQDIDVGGMPLWEFVAKRVQDEWDVEGSCMLVVGATYPDEMRRVRQVAPGLTFLVPGVGAQGGDVNEVVAAGIDANGRGLMISSSRQIIYSDDPGAAAKALRDEINVAREAVHAAS